MKSHISTLILFICISVSAQEPQGFVSLDGGYMQDLNFSASVIGNVGRAVGEAEYFYSNNGEIFSISAGAMPMKEENWMMIVTFGAEINNGWLPRMSTDFWRRIGPNDIWAKVGVETVDADPYLNIGFVVKINKEYTREKRFF